MIILHITRHGQVLPASDESWTHADYPPGDGPLSALGLRQAVLLGHRLKALEFTGPIYASPYRRTMETACGVAEIVDTTVHPAPAMREIVKRVEQMEHFVGLTNLELGQLHPRVETSPDLADMWWTMQAESDAEIEQRVAALVDNLLRQDKPDSESHVLLVGHGASTGGVIDHLLRRSAPDLIGPPIPGWNCSLSTFRCRGVDSQVELVCRQDTDHLPDEAITSNAQTREQVLASQQGQQAQQ